MAIGTSEWLSGAEVGLAGEVCCGAACSTKLA